MRIRIQPAFAAYLIIIAVFSSPAACAGSILALVVHEAGHMLAAAFFGIRAERIELTPFGGVMEYGFGKCPAKGLKGVLTASAGPMSNYLVLIALGHAGEFLTKGGELISAAAASNLAMMCINLLPVLPLDGGRILFSIGYYFLPVSPLISTLSMLGGACGGIGIAGAIYGAWLYSKVNLSLLLVGGYMIWCARQCATAMLTENTYAVIQERKADKEKIRRLRLYSVPEDTVLSHLLPLMDCAQEAVFVCGTEEGRRAFFEEDICRELLRSPTARISEVPSKPCDFEK